MSATCGKSNIINFVTDRQTYTGDNVSVLLSVVDDYVMGVTRLHDVVYIVCWRSAAIIRFDVVAHERLTDITVKGLSEPWDIVACQQTAQLYVADSSYYFDPDDDDYDRHDAAKCVWQVSSDGEDVKRLLPKSPSDTIKPYTLSVTSSRLLVTSRATNQLRQYDTVGDELRRVDLPDNMTLQHAVESPTGTFIVSHENTQLKQWQVSEVNTGGQVLRQFSGSRLLPLGVTPHVAVDSQGNIFLAHRGNNCILLLDSKLALRRFIIDEHQLNYKEPRRLCYNELTRQLLVGFDKGGDVAVFDVLRR